MSRLIYSFIVSLVGHKSLFTYMFGVHTALPKWSYHVVFISLNTYRFIFLQVLCKDVPVSRSNGTCLRGPRGPSGLPGPKGDKGDAVVGPPGENGRPGFSGRKGGKCNTKLFFLCKFFIKKMTRVYANGALPVTQLYAAFCGGERGRNSLLPLTCHTNESQ